MITLDDVEAALRQAAAAVVPAASAGPRLTRAVIDRSRRYTSERSALAAPTDGDGDLAARALFFTVADVDKVMVPLAELAGAGALPVPAPGRPLVVLDLGAGCGALGLGLLRFLAARPGGASAVHLTMVDRDARALAIARAALATVAAAASIPLEIVVRVGDVGDARARAGTAPVDLVLCGSVLNELAEADRVGVITGGLDRLEPAGALVIIEPALQATARALHALRDHVVAHRLGHVFAPCTRAEAPCPMLTSADAWCHEERPNTLPERARQLATTTGLRDGELKFAYLVLRHRPANVGGTDQLRVIGRPRHEKGKIEVPVCGQDGATTVRLLRRHRGAGNSALDDARRGDVLALTPARASGDLGPDDEVRVQHVPGGAR